MMATMIGAVVAALALFFWYIAPSDKEAYGEFGRKVNALDRDHFKQFWTCALQGGAVMANVRNNEDLEAAINQRAQRGVKRFGALVRDRCMTKLNEYEPKLETLFPPEGFAEQVTGLRAAVHDLQGGWSELIGHLDTLETYDIENPHGSVRKISKGWYDYQRNRVALNKMLKQRLEN